MEEIRAKAPWQAHLGDLPSHLDYVRGSLYEAVDAVARRYPKNVALDFMGRTTTYRQLMAHIDRCASSLTAMGVSAGDRVTLALPNCPQAVYLLYAINRVGAVANMIHPLSAEKEMEFYLTDSGSKLAVTLDSFYEKVSRACQGAGGVSLLIASIGDALSPPMKIGYQLTEGRKTPPFPKGQALRWKDFLRLGRKRPQKRPAQGGWDHPAAILYSGGTTGTTKGILLTNGNLNALAGQIVAANPMFEVGDRMLAAMPLFHGFGLGVCLHSMLANGGRCVLIPRFTAESYARQIEKNRCNFIAGVPTLFEALLRLPGLEKADFSSLKGVFSGGDSLSTERKKKVDAFLAAHKAKVQIREGYGTTETVTACCLTPPHKSKEGSIGLPLPDVYMKIVKPGTEEECPYGEEGEILVAGPTVMKEYVNQPEETAKTLRRHADGLTWVCTGDLGSMDSEGFVYFRGRAKRMIVSSGYNIYPAQLESVLDACPLVAMSCVIGVPDPYRVQKVKAFVKLASGVPATEETREELMAYCREHMARYALPRDIVFKETLPTTLVGKVAYRVLEEEEGKGEKPSQ